jgi:hypothetical protein
MQNIAVFALVASTAFPLAAQRSDTIVKQVGAPRHAGTATLVPEVTIGGPDATADEYIFVAVRVLLAAKDGSVWVSDGRFPMGPFSLRRYDSTGKFVRNVGARGNGPGEWQMPGHLTELPNGRVVLRENVVGRPLTFYRSNGDYDTTWAMHTMTVSYVNADTANNIWMQAAAGVSLMPTAPRVIVRFTPTGRLIDTVQQPALTPVSRTTLSVSNGRSTSGVFVPYQPSAFRAWSPHGYYATGTSSRYAIDLFAPPANSGGRLWKPGDPIVSIRRAVPPVVVSDAERSDQRAHMEAQAAALPGTRSSAIPDVPREKQLVRYFDFDLDGRIWVSVSQPSERFDPPPPPPARAGAAPQSVLRWREPTLYEVLEPNGTFIGRVAIPSDVRLEVVAWTPIQSRGEHVWGVATDSDGVQSVRRYRITWR